MNRPFDEIAGKYDLVFEGNPITRSIRPLVWNSLLQHFELGDHVLELNCGTGTDAIMLAQHGISVTGFDASEQMIHEAKAKIQQRKLEAFINFHVLDFQEMPKLRNRKYDGTFSNFGGLNCTPFVAEIAEYLSYVLKPNGVFVACIMNNLPVWEIGSYLARGRVDKAFRRIGPQPVSVDVGSGSVPVWYYSPRQFMKLISPWFEVQRVYGLSILSPSPNSPGFASNHPRITARLLKLDERIRSRFPYYAMGDHFVVESRKIGR